MTILPPPAVRLDARVPPYWAADGPALNFRGCWADDHVGDECGAPPAPGSSLCPWHYGQKTHNTKAGAR